MSEPAFRVTVEDLETGDRKVVEVCKGDYVLIPFEPCHRAGIQTWPLAGTHIITINGYRPAGPARFVEGGETRD